MRLKYPRRSHTGSSESDPTNDNDERYMSNQEKTWNATFDNDRAYMIELVAEANVSLNGKPPTQGR